MGLPLTRIANAVAEILAILAETNKIDSAAVDGLGGTADSLSYHVMELSLIHI